MDTPLSRWVWEAPEKGVAWCRAPGPSLLESRFEELTDCSSVKPAFYLPNELQTENVFWAVAADFVVSRWRFTRRLQRSGGGRCKRNHFRPESRAFFECCSATCVL